MWTQLFSIVVMSLKMTLISLRSIVQILPRTQNECSTLKSNWKEVIGTGGGVNHFTSYCVRHRLLTSFVNFLNMLLVNYMWLGEKQLGWVKGLKWAWVDFENDHGLAWSTADAHFLCTIIDECPSAWLLSCFATRLACIFAGSYMGLKPRCQTQPIFCNKPIISDLSCEVKLSSCT